SIGQCGYDHDNIARMIQHRFGAEVIPAATAEEGLDYLRQDTFHLILVNRILDLSGQDGHTIIEQLKADPELRNVPVMLVSNLQEAQARAIAAGAVPGFGKDSLTQVATIDTLREHLE